MRLRSARPDDEVFIRTLWMHCLREEYPDLKPEEQAAEWTLRYQHQPRHLMICEDETGQADIATSVGFIWLLSLPDPTFTEGNWWLYYIAVVPSSRGRGLARTMLDQAREALPGTIRLLVRCDSPVRALYRRVGAHPSREEWHWPARND